MSRLDKKLALWQQNNLISNEQVKSIKDFENKNNKSHLFYALLSLGIFIIALGIISLIAANWNNISDLYKLAAEFILLFGLSTGAFTAYDRSQKLVFEMEILALFFLIGASIGLNAQIFQTTGSINDGMILWAAFSVPLLWLSSKKLISLFWVPITLVGFCGNYDFLQWFENIIEHIITTLGYPLTIATAILFLGVLCTLFRYLQKQLSQPFALLSVLSGYCEFFIYFCAVFALIDELSLTMMIISVTTFALGCAYHFYTNSKKLMNFNISMIGVCFFIAYLNLFADLTSTGIGLIISGIVLLGLLLITKKLIKYLSMLKEKTHG